MSYILKGEKSMNPTYEKLYDLYACEILKKSGAYDEPALQELVDHLSIDDASKLQLLDQMFVYYLRWTLDAFSIGLQLGVRLLSGPGLRQ